MRALAESRRINVGLAAADRDEMVYLESIRYSRRVAFRNVVSELGTAAAKAISRYWAPISFLKTSSQSGISPDAPPTIEG